MPKIFVSIALFIFACDYLHAQEFKFKHIAKENGLSQNRVNSIVQDTDGFIWFGTDDGLNRYNGQEIQVYKNDSRNEQSISDNWINCLLIGPQQRLLIGTLEGGINIYNKYDNSFTAIKSNPRDPQTLSSNAIQCMVVNDDHSIWIGTDDGLNLLDLTTNKVRQFKDEMVNPNNPGSVIKNDNIRALCLDNAGKLWIGTARSGLLCFDTKTSQFSDASDSTSNTVTINNRHRIRTLYIDSQGYLWIGYDGGFLSKYNRKTGAYKYYVNDENDFKSISSNRITSILEDHKGQLWIGSSDGINTYDNKNDNFRVIRSIDKNPFSLRDNFVRCLFEDNANSIWVGTDSYGVSVYHRSSGKFRHISKDSYDASGLKSNTIFCFEEAGPNKIWLGTIGDGLAEYDVSKNTFTHYGKDKNFTHDNILCLERVDNRLWFGTWGGGLNYYDLEKEKFSKNVIDVSKGLSNDNVIDIEVDEKGNLWLATLRGLNYYDTKSGAITSYQTNNGLPHNMLYCLNYQDEEHLWIGSNGGGLILFNTKKKTFEQFLRAGKNTISNNTVHCIVDDQKGNLWLGTKNGLSKYTIKNNTFTNYTESDGLSNNFIVGILIDRVGNLWISTYNGLTRFNPNALAEERQFQNRKYFAIDGLQGDEFNQNAFFKTSKGEFYFGGTGGFNHFYPENIVDNPYIPPVIITSFKVAGKEFELDSSILYKHTIELSYRNNFFSFEFASLDYILPEKILYSYKMEGLDKDWSIPSNRPYASFTDLQGGDYVFRVKATNNDGVWNETGVAIAIRIIPPFYKTKLFYSLCIFVSILMVFIFIRVRISSIKKEKKRLEEMVDLRTKELAEKNKDITSSIEYAKRIQEAILPEKSIIFSHLPDSFILYRPKDIVSGDFYWYSHVGGKEIFAVVDCTGHGVPGAFMSMIGHNLLNQIILENKILDPAKILEQLRVGVRQALKQESDENDSSDGMDIALVVIDKSNSSIDYAGAFRPLIIVRAATKSIEKIEGVKSPIGGAKSFLMDNYITHHRKLNPGDAIYMYSDGFVDQFGGDHGKKFMGKKLHRILLEIHDKPMTEQNFLLLTAFENWSKGLEQVDDVLLVGIKL